MNSKTTILIALGVATAAGLGYWGGQRSHTAAAGTATTPTAQVAARKPLFYRNPMGLADTSPVPKKDPMGMDYVAVFEGEKDTTPTPVNQIKISADKVQKLGVRTEVAILRTLDRTARAAGRIEPDERRSYTISPKFEGYIERLQVSATGQAVSKGQPLFEVYSPELVSAQREYAIAAQGVRSLKDAGGDAGSEARAGMQRLADSSLMRLKNWDISEEQITALGKSGETKRTLTFRSPVSGIVTEKKAVQGMRFMPGETLYQITDLSTVWVLADVFEQDIGQVKVGTSATVKINAYPGKDFKGSIAYIYPTLTAETRTVPVRLELANPGALLKPGMFAEIELAVGDNTKVITVPTSAVIDSGTRRIVLIQVGEGRFEPREVKLGARTDTYVAITQGVTEGELVVVAANFLIDAESNLKAAVGGFGQATAAKPGATGAPAAVAPAAHSGH
ncbi:MAG: efflux RND transporter periplasmic adaptor subunit [Rhodocyclaceae bacterium]|nr:efflux RND transporter periplasmic adaptor subunit [Rhodocyclaceae bacterium]